jgi:FkbM family methyltransferase
MYTQGEEEQYILEFFGDKKGRVLEIGAYHPTVFSNSRALIERGWEAVLVEPSPKCFKFLSDFYENDDKVQTVQIAIGSKNGKLVFYDSGGANATGHIRHYNRWKDIQLDYEETLVDCVTWRTFYNSFPGVYEFISIDCEGMDWEVLQQIDLDETGTDLVCIEYGWNTKEIKEYLLKSGFSKIFFMSGENLIVGR